MCFIRSVCCVALVAVVPSLAAAATTEPATLSAERMWSLERLGSPAISPDGRLAVVPVTRYDIPQNKGLTDLWLFNLADGTSRQLTGDEAADSEPVFSPDGKSVAFVSRRGTDELAQIYVIPVDGGEARRLTNLPTGADLPKWFPDGRRIAFASFVWNDLVRWEDQAKRLSER
jgi:Tol biopolymer transport system component